MPKKIAKDTSPTNKAINIEFGKGTVRKLSEQPDDIERIGTGSIFIDRITGGGYPVGRIVEIFGSEAVGKTTLTIHAMIEAQKKYPTKPVLFIDVEQSLDVKYASNLGLDLDRVFHCQPEDAETALEIAKTHALSGEVSLIVVDSIAGLASREEVEKKMGEFTVAVIPRLLGKFLRPIMPLLKQNNICLILINQERVDISIRKGDPNITPGGKAPKYMATLRLKLRRKALIKKLDEIKGVTTKVEVVKNKTYIAYQSCTIDLIGGNGIEKELEVIAMARELEIITIAGSWVKYRGDTIAQGIDAASKRLKEDKEFFDKLLGEIEATLDN